MKTCIQNKVLAAVFAAIVAIMIVMMCAFVSFANEGDAQDENSNIVAEGVNTDNTGVVPSGEATEKATEEQTTTDPQQKEAEGTETEKAQKETEADKTTTETLQTDKDTSATTTNPANERIEDGDFVVQTDDGGNITEIVGLSVAGASKDYLTIDGSKYASVTTINLTSVNKSGDIVNGNLANLKNLTLTGTFAALKYIYFSEVLTDSLGNQYFTLTDLERLNMSNLAIQQPPGCQFEIGCLKKGSDSYFAFYGPTALTQISTPSTGCFNSFKVWGNGTSNQGFSVTDVSTRCPITYLDLRNCICTRSGSYSEGRADHDQDEYQFINAISVCGTSLMDIQLPFNKLADGRNTLLIDQSINLSANCLPQGILSQLNWDLWYSLRYSPRNSMGDFRGYFNNSYNTANQSSSIDATQTPSYDGKKGNVSFDINVPYDSSLTQITKINFVVNGEEKNFAYPNWNHYKAESNSDSTTKITIYGTDLQSWLDDNSISAPAVMTVKVYFSGRPDIYKMNYKSHTPFFSGLSCGGNTDIIVTGSFYYVANEGTDPNLAIKDVAGNVYDGKLYMSYKDEFTATVTCDDGCDTTLLGAYSDSTNITVKEANAVNDKSKSFKIISGEASAEGNVYFYYSGDDTYKYDIKVLPVSVTNADPTPITYGVDGEKHTLKFRIQDSLSPSKAVVVGAGEDESGVVTIPVSVTYNGNNYYVMGVNSDAFVDNPNITGFTFEQGSFCEFIGDDVISEEAEIPENSTFTIPGYCRWIGDDAITEPDKYSTIVVQPSSAGNNCYLPEVFANFKMRDFTYETKNYGWVNECSTTEAGSPLTAGTFRLHKVGTDTYYDAVYNVKVQATLDGAPLADNDIKISQEFYEVAQNDNLAYADTLDAFAPESTATTDENGYADLGEQFCGLKTTIETAEIENTTLAKEDIDGLDCSDVYHLVYTTNSPTPDPEPTPTPTPSEDVSANASGTGSTGDSNVYLLLFALVAAAGITSVYIYRKKANK